jgi:aryl-alcohol dehydrogenase-like predicted oxidoreductase
LIDREASLHPGRATREGTQRYAGRFSHLPEHFRATDGLALSSIALGTRRGRPGGSDDLLYRAAAFRALELGCNVLNTAHSDRMQTSERAIGSALASAFAEGIAARDEVCVVSKGGALVNDPDITDFFEARRHTQRTFIDSGVLDPAKVVQGFALDARFLRDQIERSRKNLRLETLDLYLIEEPEKHLRELGATNFRKRLVEVFEMLESAVRDGAIGAYGVATWDGFLVPASEREHLAVVDVFDAALEAGSGDHHMRAVQLPYGLALGDAAALDSQLGPDGKRTALLRSLRDTGTIVFASAPLFGGRVLGRIPDFVGQAFPEATSDAQVCLQFARSTEGISTAVVGMRDPDHVEENLATARFAPASSEVPAALFRGV